MFILQLSVCFKFRISGCRIPTSVAALINTHWLDETKTDTVDVPVPEGQSNTLRKKT